MFVDLGEEFFQDPVMMTSKALQFGEPGYEEAVHSISWVSHESVESPEGVFFVVEVHEEKSRDLRHALTVSDFRVVDTVSDQDFEQFLLFYVVSFLEHVIVPESSVHVQVDLSDIGRMEQSPVQHLLVPTLLFFSDTSHAEQQTPHSATDIVRDPFVHTLSQLLPCLSTVPLRQHLHPLAGSTSF